jgi:hypothetical protein
MDAQSVQSCKRIFEMTYSRNENEFSLQRHQNHQVYA